MNVSGPIKKLVVGHSTCGSASIGCLDWRSWYLDSGFGDGCYLHVRHLSKYDGVTYHRVYPRKVRGRVCHRIAMLKGRLYWLHDLPNTGLERTQTRSGSRVRSEPSLGSGSGAGK